MIIWDVSQVNRHVRDLVDADDLLRDLWVEGEVSNFVVAMSGHAYFTLKDAKSQLRCVMFRGQLARIRKRPQNGDRCVARGPLRVYETQGTYQLYAEFIAPSGLGEAQLELAELMVRLEAEGLFETSRKRPLPAWPSRIGVVTSSSGAVIHDIETVIARRWPLGTIVLAPAPVQGDDAPPRICEAIHDLNELGQVDVLILARGGGSIEDLAPFNDEAVARAIFASQVPVVSAIGHETDVTIADLVADCRAPTPSAAAELVVPSVAEVQARLAGYATSLVRATRDELGRRREELGRAELELAHQSPKRAITSRKAEINSLLARASRSIQHGLELNGERLSARAFQVNALNPIAILERGFSMAWRIDDGQIVKSVADAGTGRCLRTRLRDGTFDSVVTEGDGLADGCSAG
jgi:exodeoxyribonuclease VII large subunit